MEPGDDVIYGLMVHTCECVLAGIQVTVVYLSHSRFLRLKVWACGILILSNSKFRRILSVSAPRRNGLCFFCLCLLCWKMMRRCFFFTVFCSSPRPLSGELPLMFNSCHVTRFSLSLLLFLPRIQLLFSFVALEDVMNSLKTRVPASRGKAGISGDPMKRE